MYSYPHKTAYRHLDGISLEDYASCLAGPGHGLYLHLPFCRTKCGYCNLFSVTGLVLGIVTAMEKDRYRLFPSLGIVCNLLALLGIGFVVYAGMYL